MVIVDWGTQRSEDIQWLERLASFRFGSSCAMWASLVAQR